MIGGLISSVEASPVKTSPMLESEPALPASAPDYGASSPGSFAFFDRRFVLVENVAALLGRGIDVVLGDLAALGFDAEWDCIPAAAVGAPSHP